MTGPSPRVIRGFARLDLLVTAPLALPGLAGLVIDAFYAVEPMLGGAAVAPGFAPLHWLFVHLAGLLGVVWAWARLTLPDPRLARIDGLGRLAVGAGLAIFLVAFEAPRVLAILVATELAGAFAQLRGGSGAPGGGPRVPE